MVKYIAVGALACLMTAGINTEQTKAGSQTRDLFADVTINASSAAVIANATRAAIAYREQESYAYNDGISTSENAVAACFHAADWEVRRKRRGLHARLDRVKKVKNRDERLKVTMLVTNFYRNGKVQRWVKCHVQHDQVVFFKYS